jgi:hypothetical protein
LFFSVLCSLFPALFSLLSALCSLLSALFSLLCAAQVEALLHKGTSAFEAFAASLEFEESPAEVQEQVSSRTLTFCYMVNPSHLYARPEMLEMAIALSLDAQVSGCDYGGGL